MDVKGHLHASNSTPFTGDEPTVPIPVGEAHLHIADITTYANDVKDPVIEQSDDKDLLNFISKVFNDYNTYLITGLDKLKLIKPGPAILILVNLGSFSNSFTIS